MRCVLCGRQTDWDNSYGKRDYIVCSNCFEIAVNQTMVDFQKDRETATLAVFKAILEKGDTAK